MTTCTLYHAGEPTLLFHLDWVNHEKSPLRRQGTAPPAAPVPPKSDASSTTAATERGIDSVPVPHAPSTATGLSGMTPGETGEKAKHLFGQGLSAVQVSNLCWCTDRKRGLFLLVGITTDFRTPSPSLPTRLTRRRNRPRIRVSSPRRLMRSKRGLQRLRSTLMR